MLFGASAKTFAQTSLETTWTEAQCEEYIDFNKLWDLKDQVISRNQRESPQMWKLITCATDIRNKFFKTYAGLMSRIERERVFAYEHGYVRSWHGACRRIPELFLMDHSSKGRSTGDDNILYSRMIGNLQNICANTAIQNLEACSIFPAMTEIHNWFKENNMKSFFFNSVHDSADLCLHRSEVDVVMAKVYEVFTRRLSLFDDVPKLVYMPLDIDAVIGDITKGDYYKAGTKYKFKRPKA